MLVPVTAMRKHSHLVAAQYNVWSNFTDLTVKPESVTEFMQRFSGKNFRLCVATTYAGHHLATSRLVYNLAPRFLSDSWCSTLLIGAY